MLKMTKVSKIYRTDTVQTHALREFSLRSTKASSSP